MEAPPPPYHEKLHDLPPAIMTITAPSTLLPSGQDTQRTTDDKYPDGGLRAWLVVLGGVCNFFATFGLINSWGVFQLYYTNQGLSGASSSNIAWIGSIQYSFLFLPGLVSGRLLDRGHYHGPLLSASVLLVSATLAIAECRKYWQILICQGIITGLAAGVIYGPTVAVVSQWFLDRRATALGVVATGSSLGGVTMPIVFRYAVPAIGFSWTMRLLALIVAINLGISNLTLRPRLPPSPPKKGLLALSALKIKPFAILTVSALFTFLGSTTLLTYIGASAEAAGMPLGYRNALLPVANACSAIGRIASGLLADRFGAINILAPFTVVSALLTFAWAFVHQASAFLVIAVLYGIACGAYVSLSAIPIMGFGRKEDAGRRIGVFQTAMALSALGGAPISGAIHDATHGYEAVGVYAGSMVMISVILMLVARYLILGQWRGRC